MFRACIEERRSNIVPFITYVINCLHSSGIQPLLMRHSSFSPAQDSTNTSIVRYTKRKRAAARISVQTIKQLISVCDWINYISCISVEKVFQSWVVLERLRYEISIRKIPFLIGFQISELKKRRRKRPKAHLSKNNFCFSILPAIPVVIFFLWMEIEKKNEFCRNSTKNCTPFEKKISTE